MVQTPPPNPSGQSGESSGGVLSSSVPQTSGEARHVAEELTSQGRQLLEQQKETVASSLTSVARALHSVGQELETEQPQMAGYASRMASSVERFSSSFRDRDFSDVKRQAEDFARLRPALFLGGCVAIGFALSRFLKASPSGGAENQPSVGERFEGERSSDEGEIYERYDPYSADPTGATDTMPPSAVSTSSIAANTASLRNVDEESAVEGTFNPDVIDPKRGGSQP